MKKINWKVRVKNKTFWLALIPAILLLLQEALGVFGVTFDVSVISEKLTGIVSTVFAVLAILGVVVDPTTEGVCDSCQALEYTEPKPKE